MNVMSSSNLTIPQFCERFNLSLSTYYRLKRNGRGPRELRIGRRVIIPVETQHHPKGCEPLFSAYTTAFFLFTFRRPIKYGIIDRLPRLLMDHFFPTAVSTPVFPFLTEQTTQSPTLRDYPRMSVISSLIGSPFGPRTAILL